jgi:hypothetical protein
VLQYYHEADRRQLHGKEKGNGVDSLQLLRQQQWYKRMFILTGSISCWPVVPYLVVQYLLHRCSSPQEDQVPPP